MKKNLVLTVALSIIACLIATFWLLGVTQATDLEAGVAGQSRPSYYESEFDVEVLVNGRPLYEYEARGKTYIEAVEGAEYELRIRNPYPYRVAVALSVDGLNSIDARRTSAWNASKWVINPYETVHVSGWQMSSNRARRFYFTTERDSYAAKLGQTANFGVISAVFYRELPRRPVPLLPPPGGRYEDRKSKDQTSDSPSASTEMGAARKQGERQIRPTPDDEFAATGIGRSVENEVRWIRMELDTRPAAEVSIRYEYYSALVRLGIVPRQYVHPDPLRRREGARGFEDRRFSPEP